MCCCADGNINPTNHSSVLQWNLFQFDMDNSRIEDCVNRVYEREYEMYNMTSRQRLCSQDDTSHSQSILANISIIYGNESETKRVCQMEFPTTHFPEVGLQL